MQSKTLYGRLDSVMCGLKTLYGRLDSAQCCLKRENRNEAAGCDYGLLISMFDALRGCTIKDGMIHEQIRAALHTIEHEDDVCIFYACESGSRAWGFPSADSDYDVRFLYVHPTAWYLSIDVESRCDVIERPINDQLDIVGWDLRKALTLFRKSNPPLLEWLNSPIVYTERLGIADRLRQLLPDYYSPTASFYHYLHMAQGNFRDYLHGEIV